MKNLIVITILFLFLSLSIKAQDTVKLKARPDSVIKIIPFEVGKHTSYLYSIDGKMQTPKDIRIRLMSYAPSANEYTRAKINYTWGSISYAGFAATGIAAVIEYATHNKHNGETTAIVNGQPDFVYQKHGLTGAYVLTGIATGFLTSAIINLVNGKKHRDKALKLYNQQFE